MHFARNRDVEQWGRCGFGSDSIHCPGAELQHCGSVSLHRHSVAFRVGFLGPVKELGMFYTFEIRHLNAVIALAESLNYSRAADRLHITQSGFSKQIAEVEDQLGFSLFVRDGKRVTDLTHAGRVFVEHARLAISHNQRAIQLACAAHQGAESFLHAGHLPDADRSLISALLAIRLPLYPKLEIRLSSDFVPELVGGVLTGSLDLALITAPPPDSRTTAVSLVREPLYAALSERHPAARQGQLSLKHLAHDTWIVFQHRVNPEIHYAIMRLAEREGFRPRRLHQVLFPQEAIDAVIDDLGVAFLPRAAALRYGATSIVLHPFRNEALWFDTCLVMKAENSTRMTNEFARAFLRRVASLHGTPVQLDLPIAG